MKRRTFISSVVGVGCLSATSIAMAEPVLIYRVSDGQALEYLTSENTAAYVGRPDVVIKPVMPAGVPVRYIIVEGGVPRAMTQAERDAKDTAELAAMMESERTSARDNITSDMPLGRAVRALLEVIAGSTGRTRAQVRNAFIAAIDGNV